MPLLFADAETASELDVTKVGADVYARHPSTRALLWGVRAPEWPRALVFERDGFWGLVREIRRTKQIEWPADEPLTVVHWSPFDRVLVVLREQAPAFPVEWLDLQAVSLSYGGPAQLAAAAAWWGGSELKDPGKHLISRFCKRQKDGRWITPQDDPVRWERFRSYAMQDVDAMVPIYDRLAELAQEGAGGHRWSLHEPGWDAVRRMNERGIPIDRFAAQAATEACAAAEERLVEECRETYGIEPSQTEQVRARLGLADVQKETLEAWIDDLDPEVRRLAEIRLETAGAARKKLGPMLRMSREEDPRVRGAFRYHGAWTRRLSSLGLQAQNFVRGKSDPVFFEQLGEMPSVEGIFEAVRTNIRGFIAAEPGGVLVAADLAQIELRVGAWLAGEQWLLDALANGEDAYKITAGELFGKSAADIAKPSPERDFGKVVELGSMYQLGGRGLQRQAKPQGIELSEAEAKRAIDIYRATHPAFVESWREMQDVFMQMVGAPAGSRTPVLGGRCWLERWSTHIRLLRPSGFGQYFWCPELRLGQWPDGGERWEITYVGLAQGGKMGLQETYGGNIFQGAVQGAAADLILEALIRVEAAGFHPIMSIHDEIVCEIGDDGESYVDELCELVAALPEWAEGLPVEAEGWQGPRFTKA